MLAQLFGIPHVATGEIIRDQIAQATAFGRKVEAQIAAGNFASDSDVLYWVRDRIAKPDAAQGYVLDGFPRDIAQAEAFTERLDVVVSLVASDGALIERLSGRLVCPQCETTYHAATKPPKQTGLCDRDGMRLVRRPDDEPIAVRHRLRLYHQVTEPLQEYYDRRGLLVRADALEEAKMVTGRILDSLSRRALANRKF